MLPTPMPPLLGLPPSHTATAPLSLCLLSRRPHRPHQMSVGPHSLTSVQPFLKSLFIRETFFADHCVHMRRPLVRHTLLSWSLWLCNK